ncbi:nucleotide exchange factor GrpE [Roseobacter sp.]|uniref:nucleotide exchange factor GrpE n=1 Tax=Roseobacter sp. TaxID=1907202 RepID=UPI0025E342A3|nr:nucleotide exchange factor GrpE [Roseobacter sp.]
MDKSKEKTDQTADKPEPEKRADAARDKDVELEVLTDKWKRALAEAENARKRADAAHADGRQHGVAIAVEALAPVYDDICLAIDAARASPDADAPAITAHLDGLKRTRTAFETALKALGVRTLKPENTPFDPVLHEAIQMQETEKSGPGQVLVLHRPGFVLGHRLIRPAHVTVSASPGKSSEG